MSRAPVTRWTLNTWSSAARSIRHPRLRGPGPRFQGRAGPCTPGRQFGDRDHTHGPGLLEPPDARAHGRRGDLEILRNLLVGGAAVLLQKRNDPLVDLVERGAALRS